MNRNLLHSLVLLMLVVILLITRQWWVQTKFEYGLAVAGILIAGIPHGAMDHFTASFLKGTKFKLIKYLLQYLFSALVYLAVWFLFPGFAFLLFLLLTAWHFGETDLVCFSSKEKPSITIFVYGFCLLMWLLLKNAAAILYWTEILTGKEYYAQKVISWLLTIPHGWWFAISAALMMLTVYKNKNAWLGTALFLGFVFCTVYTSLILGFVIYFTGWHSLQALQHINLSVFKGTSIKKMIINALPATLGSIVLLAVILTDGKAEWIQSSSLPSLFILLSVLTLPHMAQMHRLYNFTASNKV